MLKRTGESSVAVKLRQLKHAEPFSPFKIKLTGGATLTVTRADRFMVSPGGNTAVLYPKEEPGLHFLELHEVISIESALNGRSKPQKRRSRRRDNS